MLNKISQNFNTTGFTGNNNNSGTTMTDNFIKGVKTATKLEEKGDFFTRMMWAPTVTAPVITGILLYELKTVHSINKAKKTNNLALLNQIRTGLGKKFLLLGAFGVGIIALFQGIFSRNTSEKFENFKKEFNEINTSTDAKLSDRMIFSSVKGAYCNALNCEITINKIMLNDPIKRLKLKKIVKHELVHARQYETIARSKDGIKKLNYAVVKNTAKNMNNPIARAELNQIYNELQQDKTGKYDNCQIEISGTKTNLKNFINGVYILLNDKNATKDDIPIIIDTKHYQDVINKKGKLTPEEEIMAEKYYQAQINYPKLTLWNMLNPFSAYYDNLLEKEAYKENPGFYGFIRKIFGK